MNNIINSHHHRKITTTHHSTLKVVLSFYRTSAWFQGVTQRNQPVPILYYEGTRSMICARRWAYAVGRLFTSEYQARLWCFYQGFGFVLAELQTASKGFHFSRAGLLYWRVRPCEDFHVEAYASHRAVCPDCQRQDVRDSVASICERVKHASAASGG